VVTPGTLTEIRCSFAAHNYLAALAEAQAIWPGWLDL